METTNPKSEMVKQIAQERNISLRDVPLYRPRVKKQRENLKLVLTPQRLSAVIFAGLEKLNGVSFEGTFGEVVSITEDIRRQGMDQRFRDVYLIEIAQEYETYEPCEPCETCEGIPE